MFSTLPEGTRQLALGAVTVIAFAVIARLAISDAKGDRVSQTALTAIMAGAVGNLIDRFLHGAVVDFLDVYVGSYHWPSFNVADSAICLGVTLLLCRQIFSPGSDTAD
jgi:signal peptidase II